MITTRVIALVLNALVIAGFHICMIWTLRQRGPKPGLACPGCRYDLDGVRTRRCPECGCELSSERFTRAARRWTTVYLFLAAFETLLMPVPIWAVGSTTVEIHWMTDHGPAVFVPGLVKDKGNAASMVAAGCIALWALLGAHSFYAASRASRRTSAILREMGEACQRLSEQPASSYGG